MNGNAQSGGKPKKSLWRGALKVLIALVILGILAYGGLIAFVCYQEAHVEPPGDYDSIIVLGAQVLPSGEPSVQLRWRLDKAEEMYGLSPCPVVVCGSMAGMEPMPEGEVMRRVLIGEGVPEEHVYAETTSVSTKQNLQNAMVILSGLGCESPLVVTSDYHLPRALAIARDAGLEPMGAGSPCRPEFEFWAKNHMREALAWVKYWGIKYLGLPL